jgi:hypothetical protein
VAIGIHPGSSCARALAVVAALALLAGGARGGCPADLNGSGSVDVEDLVTVILDWGCPDPPGPCPGNVNGDGQVDVQDLVDVILSWGPCPLVGPCANAIGNCALPHGSPGCDDPDCCQEVCAADRFCCEVEWDVICAAEAQQICDLPCPGQGGSCFEPHAGGGCDALECCIAVCDADPACCDTTWDAQCVAGAQKLCGDAACNPAAGPCNLPNGTPGCDDLVCCMTVCLLDPFCCDVAWDQVCVNDAIAAGCVEPPAGPANDACADAEPIFEGTASFTSAHAGSDGPVPCGSIGSDVWYRFDAVMSGALTVSLCGSGFDTVLAVYGGCACPPAGAPLACNDDSCGLQSQVTVNVVAGQCYLIQAGGFDGEQGEGSITLIAPGVPVNDDCADAFPIGGGATPFDNLEATDDGPSPCGVLGSDIWYRYDATFTGDLTVSLCGSQYDTALAVYGGCACPVSGPPLACNDDACDLESEVTIAVVLGECYLIQVGGFGGEQGAGTITLTEGP